MLKLVKVVPKDIGSRRSSTICEAVIEYKPGNGKGPTLPPAIKVTDFSPIHFDIETYRNIARMPSPGQEDEGIHAFHLVSKFFATLSDTEQYLMFYYYQKMHLFITQLRPDSNLSENMMALATATTQVFSWINIPQKALDFIKTVKFRLPDLQDSHAPRSHHTEEMTFRLDEYYPLTAIVLICKIMFPVWGYAIKVMRNKSLTDDMNKELYCFSLIMDTLQNGCLAPIYTKLTNYVNRTARGAMKPRHGEANMVSFTMGMSAVDEDRFFEAILSVIAVKRLASYNIWRKKSGSTDVPNLVTYVHSAVTDTAGTRIGNMRSSNNRMARFDVSDTSPEGDNLTYMDNVARVSNITADIPVLARVGIDIEVPKFLAEHGLGKGDMRSSIRYYKIHEPTASLFNRALIASTFGKRLGSASLLQHLLKDHYVKALAATQLLLVKMGLNQLALFMSCTTDELNPDAHIDTAVDHRMRSDIFDNPAHTECKKIFPGYSEKAITAHQAKISGGSLVQGKMEQISIDRQLSRLFDWVTTYKHHYNIPPHLYEAMGIEPHAKGEVIVYDDQVMVEVCRFFTKLHKPSEDMPVHGHLL